MFPCIDNIFAMRNRALELPRLNETKNKLKLFGIILEIIFEIDNLL